MMQQVSLIIWDEMCMAHKHLLEAVSRAFSFVREDMRPFGGVVIVGGGDWAQTQHELKLKVGVPIMFIRNINKNLGMCNGSRCIVTGLSQHLIKAKLMSGPNKGMEICIPRITLSTNEEDFAFTLIRRQFPIRLCFAATINESGTNIPASLSILACTSIRSWTIVRWLFQSRQS